MMMHDDDDGDNDRYGRTIGNCEGFAKCKMFGKCEPTNGTMEAASVEMPLIPVRISSPYILRLDVIFVIMIGDDINRCHQSIRCHQLHLMILQQIICMMLYLSHLNTPIRTSSFAC